MKASVLGSLAVSLTERRWMELYWREVRKRISQGDVDPCGLPGDSDNSTVKRLLEFADLHGLAHRKCFGYVSNSVTPIRGGVPMHSDEGFGFVVSWLVATRTMPYLDKGLGRHKINWGSESDDWLIPGPEVQLVSENATLNLLPGYVFVFNADKRHGWIANCDCLLVQSTVRKKKKGRLSAFGDKQNSVPSSSQ